MERKTGLPLQEGWVRRTIVPLPSMTARQLELLDRLRDCPRGDTLEWAHKAIINSVTSAERGWVEARDVNGQVRYFITIAGRRAYAVYSAPDRRRFDGICPMCGVRPRKVNPNGKKQGYCAECHSSYTSENESAHRKGAK